MHDPQDTGFTLQSFELSIGISGERALTHLPRFAIVGCGLTVTFVIKVTATRKGESNVL